MVMIVEYGKDIFDWEFLFGERGFLVLWILFLVNFVVVLFLVLVVVLVDEVLLEE